MANGSSGANAGHGGVHRGRGVMGQAAAMGTGQARRQGQDMVTQHTAVALAHTGGAGRRLMNTMANLVNKEVASGRHNGCYHN